MILPLCSDQNHFNAHHNLDC